MDSIICARREVERITGEKRYTITEKQTKKPQDLKTISPNNQMDAQLGNRAVWLWNYGQDADRETEGEEVQADGKETEGDGVALRPELAAAMSPSHRVGTSVLRSVSDRPPRPLCPCFSTVISDPKAPQVPPEGEPKEVLSLLQAEGEDNYNLNF